jgi:serine/threonine protein kinase
MAADVSERPDRYEDLLAQYDEALAVGGVGAGRALLESSGDEALEPRLAQARACLDLLERVWPRGQSTVGDDGTVNSRPVTSTEAAGTSWLELGGVTDFRLLREIGRGGMGIVYEAEQLSLRRRVALKMMPLGAQLDQRHRQRFQNESRAAAALDHPHIVKIHAVGGEESIPYYAMQLIGGRSLAEWIAEWRRGSCGLADAERYRLVARLGIQACEALEHAHAQGVVHRDIKPANLLVDDQHWLWVADFGLARVGTDPGLTGTGDLVGTLRYMSPEQVFGKRLLDHRTDTYSLGATLYEAATLMAMFPESNREALLQAVVHEPPPLPRRVARNFPPDLETILLKSTAKDPGERYDTAQHMGDDLRRFLEHRPIQARRPGLIDRGVKWVRRHSPILTASLTTAALVLVGALFLVWHQRQAAVEAAGRATRLAEAMREHVYAADIKLANQAWWEGDVRRVMGLLRRHIPAAGEKDLRGFEWSYFWRQCQRKGVTIQASSEPLYYVTHSPDGRWIVVAGKDAVVRGYDAQTYHEVFSLATGQIEVNGLAFSGDGTTLATTGDDGTLRIWEMATKRERLKIKAHPGKAYQVAFSPDGNRLYSCGNDPTIQSWDAASGELLASWTDELGQSIECLALSQSGLRLAYGTHNG